MRKDTTIAVLGIGLLGLLALSGSSSAAEPAQTATPPQPKEPAKAPELPKAPQSKDDPPLVDPLPEFPLTQANIIDALTDALKRGQTSKLKSVVVKAKDAPIGLRVYLFAAFEAVPQQMKEDAAYVKEFAAKEAARLERLAKDPTYKGMKSFGNVTKALQTGVASLIPVFGTAMIAVSDSIWGAITDHFYDANLDGSKARDAEAQILPGLEGFGVRRGVRMRPELPYITPGERDLADRVQARWYRESEASEAFQTLPAVKEKTAFLYAPTWQNFQDALAKMRADGVV